MSSRGQYGKSKCLRGACGWSARHSTGVGVSFYHSVGDRAEAVEQLDIDWNALYQNLASQVGELVRDPSAPNGYRTATQKEWDANPPDAAKVAWWKSNALPLINKWVKFKAEQLGGDRTFADKYIAFAERWATNWSVYEDWKKKLDALREEAKKRGFTLTTSLPAPLPTTVWVDVADTVERGAGAVASSVGDTWTFVKYGAWAVLGIGVFAALASVTQNVRKGHDPFERYADILQRRRLAGGL